MSTAALHSSPRSLYQWRCAIVVPPDSPPRAGADVKQCPRDRRWLRSFPHAPSLLPVDPHESASSQEHALRQSWDRSNLVKAHDGSTLTSLSRCCSHSALLRVARRCRAQAHRRSQSSARDTRRTNRATMGTHARLRAPTPHAPRWSPHLQRAASPPARDQSQARAQSPPTIEVDDRAQQAGRQAGSSSVCSAGATAREVESRVASAWTELEACRNNGRATRSWEHARCSRSEA